MIDNTIAIRKKEQKGQTQAECSTKHHTENLRSSNMYMYIKMELIYIIDDYTIGTALLGQGNRLIDIIYILCLSCHAM
jgi:hypothetical protein